MHATIPTYQAVAIRLNANGFRDASAVDINDEITEVLCEAAPDASDDDVFEATDDYSFRYLENEAN